MAPAAPRATAPTSATSASPSGLLDLARALGRMAARMDAAAAAQEASSASLDHPPTLPTPNHKEGLHGR